MSAVQALLQYCMWPVFGALMSPPMSLLACLQVTWCNFSHNAAASGGAVAVAQGSSMAVEMEPWYNDVSTTGQQKGNRVRHITT